MLGGGKFENGAMTGAFGYLFNCMAHPETCGGRNFSQAEIDESVTFGRYAANNAYATAIYPDRRIPFYGIMTGPSDYVEFTYYIDKVVDFVGLGIALRNPSSLAAEFFGVYSNVQAGYKFYDTGDPMHIAGPVIGKFAGSTMATTTVSKINSDRYGIIYGTIVDSGLTKSEVPRKR